MAAGDEVSIGGTVNIGRPRRFDRLRGGGGTHNISASLKFDIPGLKDFKTQLDAINKSLETLNTTFTKLAAGPAAFSKQLTNIVSQMKLLQAAQIKANYMPQQPAMTQATAMGLPGMGGGTGGTGGTGGGGSGGSRDGGFGQVVTKGIEAMMKRFDAGMSKAIAADTYVSRMATYAGAGNPSRPGAILRDQGKNGFGFMATDLVQGEQVLYQGTGIGAYAGAGGVAGQRGQAYTTSIKQMQETMPGLDATQAASGQSAIYNNVQGMKMARAMLGNSVLPFKTDGPGKGQRKTQQEYFRDVLTALQKLPRPDGSTGAWSKDDIMQMNFPGSRLNAWLSAILPEEVIPMWYEWAITNAAVSAAGKGQLSDDPKTAKKQRESVFGRSLATNAQETTNREAQKDAQFGGEQYGAMNARLDYEKKTLGVLSHIDSMISGIYGIFGRVPSLMQGGVAGAIGGVVSFIGGLFGGDPGYMGDPESSTSHLTPDLRKRVNSMMKANPNISITSAYRDNKRQGDLYKQGGGPFAPSGKSKHGRGQAIDLGPPSQFGWIAKNARKFGLDSATQYREPWHVQLMGTLGIGDPPDPSGSARNLEGKMADSLIAQFIASQGTSGASTTTPSSSTGATSSAPATATTYTPGDNGKLTADQMVHLLHDAGFSGEDIVKMAGISYRESGGWNPNAFNGNAGTGDKSYGLWQINMLGGLAKDRLPLVQAAGGSKEEDLLNPEISAKVLYQMWSKSGYNPWGPYKGVSELNNVPQKALDEARAAAQQAGYLGDAGYAAPVGGGGGSTNVSVGGGTTVSFNNTFQLSFPNGASQQSVQTAVRQIAERLEPQMRRMVSRNT